MLRALAEAGHQISVVAAKIELPEHPNIRILLGAEPSFQSRQRVRVATMKASGTLKFDAVHAVDDAALLASRICAVRRLPLVYDASRCFGGKAGIPPSKRWKWFPNWFASHEKKLLSRAAAVFVPCSALEADLQVVFPSTNLVLVEDVPIQSVFCCKELEQVALLARFEEPTTTVVVCSAGSASHKELRILLMAARKVMDSVPGLSFVFRGVDSKDARQMASNLDIVGRCLFLDENSSGEFVDALQNAVASLFVPSPNMRYCEPTLFSLLSASAPVVAVHEAAYSDLLTEANSTSVLKTTDSIAEGLLRVIREPLLSLGLVTEANQLIADHYSLSSFKHKIRMVYHDVINKA